MTALKAERKAKTRNSKSTPARGRTLVKAKAAARPATTAAKARTPAKARAAAPPTDPNHQHRKSKFNSDGAGLKKPDLTFFSYECGEYLGHASKSFQRILGLRDWNRPSRAALPAHSFGKACCGLVRNHFRKLHGGWRTAAARARSDPRAVSG